jgi:hypothetical protein
MKQKACVIGRGFSILVIFVFLLACVSCSGNDQPPTVEKIQHEIPPTNTPFQPPVNTPIPTLEVGALPSATSALALSSPTNPPDIPVSTPSLPTVPPRNPTSVPTTIPTDNPTSLPTVLPPSNPTITPDIGTASPPGDPSIAILPYSVNAGGTLQIILGEFAPNEKVTIDIHLGTRLNNLQNSFVVTVDSNGSLTFNWTVPQSYAVGNYSILATGQTYGKSIKGYFSVQ